MDASSCRLVFLRIFGLSSEFLYGFLLGRGKVFSCHFFLRSHGSFHGRYVQILLKSIGKAINDGRAIAFVDDLVDRLQVYICGFASVLDIIVRFDELLALFGKLLPFELVLLEILDLFF